MALLPIGVLASGTGSNFEAIAKAIADGSLDAEVRLLICNRPQAKVLAKASARGIPSRTIEHGRFQDREEFDRALADALVTAGVELVVLAGFDRLLGPALLDRFPDRVLNIHPALLPSFKGVDAQAQAAEYGVRIAGATVHIVDRELDHGPIVVQAAVPADPGEDPDELRARILAEEHRIYPWAIQLFAEGRVQIEGRRVRIRGAVVPTGALVSPARESRAKPTQRRSG